MRAHCVTSLARPGQTNLLETMRRVARMEGCDSECSLSKVGRRQARVGKVRSWNSAGCVTPKAQVLVKLHLFESEAGISGRCEIGV